MLFAEGATDPASWGQFFGSLGPGGFALVCLLVVCAMAILFVMGALLLWRGHPKWNLKGIGEEFHASRLAQERTAAATERAERHQAKTSELQSAILQGIETLLTRSVPLPPPEDEQDPQPAPPSVAAASRRGAPRAAMPSRP